MIPHHWNYFLAVEADLAAVARYVEFSQANYPTYSTEFAHLLMTATQETDVLLHALCDLHGNTARAEPGYCSFIPTLYPKLSGYEVHVPRWELELHPFAAWAIPDTPPWWTANNKVKHERGTRFTDASLEHALTACAGLLLVEVLYHFQQGALDELWPAPQLLLAPALVASVSPTFLGDKVNFKVD